MSDMCFKYLLVSGLSIEKMSEFKVHQRKSKGNMEPGISENLPAPKTPAKPPPLRPHQVHVERRCTVVTSSALVDGCENSDAAPRFGIDLNEMIHDDPALGSQASVNSGKVLCFV